MRTLRSRGQQAFAVFVMIGIAALGATAVVPLRLTGIFFCSGAEILLWRIAIWPVLIVTDDRLIVRNLTRTHKILWGDIKDIGVDTMLRINLRNGKSVGAIAFTRANYNIWLNREGLAGRTARGLEDIRKSKTSTQG